MTSKRTPVETDNFRLIKGISRSVERRLHETGITTYDKLASLTPQGVSTIVGEVEGVTTKRIVKENWIEQARDLSARAGSEKATEENAGGAVLQSLESHRLNSFVVELLRDKKGNAERTKVLHVESGGEDTWPGWKERRLLDFFLTRTGLRLPAAEAVLPDLTLAKRARTAGGMRETIPAPMASPVLSFPVESPIQPPHPVLEIFASSGRKHPVKASSASGIFAANQPFEVRLALSFSATDAANRKPLNFRAYLYAKSLRDPLRQSIGEADGELDPSESTTVIINASPLPQGVYRLEAVVNLSEPVSKSGRKAPSILQTGEKLLRVA